jgi:hypothetical protein
MNDVENFEVEICENQSWGLHQCNSKSIPAIFKMNVDNKRLAITKELLSTEEPIYYYFYSLTLKGRLKYYVAVFLLTLYVVIRQKKSEVQWHNIWQVLPFTLYVA